jgi:hypothetical protein
MFPGLEANVSLFITFQKDSPIQFYITKATEIIAFELLLRGRSAFEGISI